jgi:very-short-patch-repair endonuclease
VKGKMNFGPLNGEGGHRRLNVAISRARESVVIYSTLMPEQIDLAKIRAAGVRDLKHYLEFALRGPKALLEQSLPTGLEPDSPFETAIIRILRDRGWVVHPQVGCSGYRIDIGVVDPRAPGRYLVGIECDGRTYHSGATARDRDRLRQHVLEGLGWNIHRIWSTDWWLNPEGEILKVIARLESLMDASNQTEKEPELIAEVPPDLVAAESEEVAPPECPSEPTAIAPLVSNGVSRIYTPSSIEAGDPESFYDHKVTQQLTAQLSQVIDAEGPVSEAVLFRKVARAWGLERTGSRIVERLRSLAPKSVHQTQEGSAKFYWPSTVNSASRLQFRLADETVLSKRHIDDVCLEEISALVLHVLHQAGGSPRQDVARSVCRLIGMARATADAEARAAKAIDQLIKCEMLVQAGTHVQLAA